MDWTTKIEAANDYYFEAMTDTRYRVLMREVEDEGYTEAVALLATGEHVIGVGRCNYDEFVDPDNENVIGDLVDAVAVMRAFTANHPQSRANHPLQKLLFS